MQALYNIAIFFCKVVLIQSSIIIVCFCNKIYKSLVFSKILIVTTFLEFWLYSLDLEYLGRDLFYHFLLWFFYLSCLWILYSLFINSLQSFVMQCSIVWLPNITQVLEYTSKHKTWLYKNHDQQHTLICKWASLLSKLVLQSIILIISTPL